MKKALFLISITTLSLTSFAQSDNGINFCGITEKETDVTTLTMTQLIDCSELLADNNNYTIESYRAIMNVSGVIKKKIVSGSKFSEKLTTCLKDDRPTKIYFRKIILIDKKGNKPDASYHTIIIK